MKDLATVAQQNRRSAFRPRVSLGAVPGQLVVHEGSVRGRIRVIQYDSTNHSDEWIESVSELKTRLCLSKNRSSIPEIPPRVAWINVDGLGDIEMLNELGKLFSIHPMALEDVVNVHQHAKLECYGDTLFFVVRMPTGEGAFQTEQVSIFLVGGVLITIQERPGDCFDLLRERIANSLGRVRKRKAAYLAYAIIDAIVDAYFPVLERYGSELDEVSQTLQGRENRSLPLHLHDVRADLLLIRKVVDQHRKALNDVLREGADLISADTLLYFRDCQDHLQQLMEAADTDRETCGELRELYFAMLGEKNNDVMKVLTIIATIFIPMSFVAGIYGMNFDNEASALNMPELHWGFGYPFALGLMFITGAGLLYYLYRKGWLSDR